MHVTSALKGYKLLALDSGRFIAVCNNSLSQNRKLGWSQRLSGRYSQRKGSLLVLGIKERFFSHIACDLVNIPTRILLLIYFYMIATEIKLTLKNRASYR